MLKRYCKATLNDLVHRKIITKIYFNFVYDRIFIFNLNYKVLLVKVV